MNDRSGSSYSFMKPVLEASQQQKTGVSIKSSPEGREVPICFDFVQGKCRRPNCRYQHDFGAVIRHNSRESRICFDHLRGECTRGSLCRFSHDLQPLIMQSLEDAARQVVEPRATGICYDFCRGACPRRGTCPWTHNLIEIAWSTAKQPLQDHQKFTILKKVLEVVLASCPHLVSEMETLQLLQQSISHPQVSSNLHLPPPFSTLEGFSEQGFNPPPPSPYLTPSIRATQHPRRPPSRSESSYLRSQSDSRTSSQPPPPPPPLSSSGMPSIEDQAPLQDFNLQALEDNLSKALDFNF